MNDAERQVYHKAIDRGWTRRDFQRVHRKLKDLKKEYFTDGFIIFPDIETLATILDEPIDYKLEWSLIRLVREDKIKMYRNGRYMIEVLPTSTRF